MNHHQADHKAYLAIGIISLLVICFLFWLIYFKPVGEGHGSWVLFLPTLNASLNTLTTFFLSIGYWFIRRGQKRKHIACMLTAVFSSTLFLISYVIYHHFQGDTRYLTEGWLRPLYFFILISHILLSIGLVPLVKAVLYQAAKKNWIVHKKLARITFPIWIYVSITGVLIYLFVHYWNWAPA